MAKLSSEGFSEAMPAELSLFDLPPTQVAVSDATFQEIRPLSQLSGDVPIEFRISAANSLDYLDLNGSMLYVKLKLTKSDGSNLEVTDKVGPVNLFLQSLFQTTEVTLQNKITSICNHNPYIAMIQSLLKNGEDCNLSQMKTQLFVKDDNDAIDDPDIGGSNGGLANRAAVVSLSKVTDLCGPIYHPFFNMGRYLLNQCDVRLKLYRSTPNFCLVSNVAGPGFAVELLDVCLLARKIKVNPALLYGHAEILKDVNAKYPYTRTECRLQSVAKGSTSFYWDSVLQGVTPVKIAIAFVETSAVSGNYKKNPFNFQNCDINEICIYADGVPVGGAPVKVNFDKTTGRTTARAFTDLFRFANKWKSDSGNDLNEDDFSSGSTLFVFQLEPFYDGQKSFINLVKTGSIRLDVQFSTPLPETMTCIVYSEAPGYFEINEQRDIITE
ncbi:MAG: hypothetical protein ABW185_22790 [Sedimenticola sp.]